MIYEYILDHIDIEINDYELLVGRIPNTPLPNDLEEVCSMWKNHPLFVPTNGTGHRVVDYERVLNHGIRSILVELNDKILSEKDDEKKKRKC